MSVPASHLAPTPLPEGKQRLIDAALRLAARDGAALTSLGLRELAREAGLNHNTFYRHFQDLQDLGNAAAEMVVAQLMEGIGRIRLQSARHSDATIGAAEYFLDFARDHRDLMVVGLRELHSLDSPMRGAMRGALDAIAKQSADQMLALSLAPGLSREALEEAASAISYYMWYRALDYLEKPNQRRKVRDAIVAFIRSQLLGRRNDREGSSR